MVGMAILLSSFIGLNLPARAGWAPSEACVNTESRRLIQDEPTVPPHSRRLVALLLTVTGQGAMHSTCSSVPAFTARTALRCGLGRHRMSTDQNSLVR